MKMSVYFGDFRVYLHELKVTTPQKKASLKIAIMFPSRFLASPHSAIKVEDPLRNLLTLAMIFLERLYGVEIEKQMHGGEKVFSTKLFHRNEAFGNKSGAGGFHPTLAFLFSHSADPLLNFHLV